jgi:acyl-CoA synthetase (AMP-forming)/AMP-acid ligase II
VDGALTVGAKIVLASHNVAASGQLLGKLIKSSGTTVMQATPATWYLLLAAKWEGNPQLKILIGGEALPKELANQLLDKVGSVWNMYGPTEATRWSTVYKVPRVSNLQGTVFGSGGGIVVLKLLSQALEDGDQIHAVIKGSARQHSAENGFCAIGSVKTNVGHLVEASGITGLIKTVLALKHKSP